MLQPVLLLLDASSRNNSLDLLKSSVIKLLKAIKNNEKLASRIVLSIACYSNKSETIEPFSLLKEKSKVAFPTIKEKSKCGLAHGLMYAIYEMNHEVEQLGEECYNPKIIVFPSYRAEDSDESIFVMDNFLMAFPVDINMFPLDPKEGEMIADQFPQDITRVNIIKLEGLDDEKYLEILFDTELNVEESNEEEVAEEKTPEEKEENVEAEKKEVQIPEEDAVFMTADAPKEEEAPQETVEEQNPEEKIEVQEENTNFDKPLFVAEDSNSEPQVEEKQEENPEKPSEPEEEKPDGWEEFM